MHETLLKLQDEVNHALELAVRERELDDQELRLEEHERALGRRERALEHREVAHAVVQREQRLARARLDARLEELVDERERLEALVGERERNPPYFVVDTVCRLNDLVARRRTRGAFVRELVAEAAAAPGGHGAREGGGGASVASAAAAGGGGTAAGGSLAGCTGPVSSDCQPTDPMAAAVGTEAAQAASDRCRRRYIVVANSQEQAIHWRERHGLAPCDAIVVSTDHPLDGLRPSADREVVLLDGWRLGRYADRISWELARQGFKGFDAPSVPAARGVSPRLAPMRRTRTETFVGQTAGRVGDALVEELEDRCELALVTVTAVVRRADGSLTGASSSATASNGWGRR
jgi:hypothetical protein